MHTPTRVCLLPYARDRGDYADPKAFIALTFPPAFLITSARCGVDDGIHPLISGSMIVNPEGHIVAENKTEEDEIIWADIDIDACLQGKQKTFCFEKHRRIEHYGILTQQAGVVEPPEPVQA